jgi:hypothetical protein
LQLKDLSFLLQCIHFMNYLNFVLEFRPTRVPESNQWPPDESSRSTSKHATMHNLTDKVITWKTNHNTRRSRTSTYKKDEDYLSSSDQGGSESSQSRKKMKRSRRSHSSEHSSPSPYDGESIVRCSELVLCCSNPLSKHFDVMACLNFGFIETFSQLRVFFSSWGCQFLSGYPMYSDKQRSSVYHFYIVSSSSCTTTVVY